MLGDALRHTDHYLPLYQASVHTPLFLGHLGMLYVVNILLCPSWTPLMIAFAHRDTDNPPKWVHMLLSLCNVTMASMLVSWAGRLWSSSLCNDHSTLNSMPIPVPLWFFSLSSNTQTHIWDKRCYDQFQTPPQSLSYLFCTFAREKVWMLFVIDNVIARVLP